MLTGWSPGPLRVPRAVPAHQAALLGATLDFGIRTLFARALGRFVLSTAPSGGAGVVSAVPPSLLWVEAAAQSAQKTELLQQSERQIEALSVVRRFAETKESRMRADILDSLIVLGVSDMFYHSGSFPEDLVLGTPALARFRAELANLLELAEDTLIVSMTRGGRRPFFAPDLDLGTAEPELVGSAACDLMIGSCIFDFKCSANTEFVPEWLMQVHGYRILYERLFRRNECPANEFPSIDTVGIYHARTGALVCVHRKGRAAGPEAWL